jgi:hypothetical protein
VHGIVNHTLGFVSQDGTHTNNFEFLVTFKNFDERENGVKRINIEVG